MYKIVTKQYLPVQYIRKQVGWGCLLNETLSTGTANIFI